MRREFRLWHVMKLYVHLQSANVRSHLMYPTNFIVGVLSIALLGLGDLALFWVITNKVTAIKGWTFTELVFLLAVFRASLGLFVIVFQQVWDIDPLMRRGDFDRYFVRPYSPLFQFSTYQFQFAGLGDLLTGTGLLIYAASHIPGWDWAATLQLIVVVVSGAAILWGIYTAIGSLSFWTMQSQGVRSIFETFLFQFSNYPLAIYAKPIRYLLTYVIPIGFINYYPAHQFFHREQGAFGAPLAYGSPLVAAVLVGAALVLWRRGLQAYQGAGT